MRRVDDLEAELQRRHEAQKAELRTAARELGGLAAIAQRAPTYARSAAPAPPSRPDYCSCVKGEGVRGSTGGWHVRLDTESGTEVVIGPCPAYAAVVKRNLTPRVQKQERQRQLLGDEDDDE